ncbi:hypothetical protein CC78DRAFT_573300 [Lojkania enalia]|uniref:Uncharacterized protein n=1 Tax=Lojkania enalia TaxID=147567 RepID=A0A9P4TQX5_9PLEO|nr:hypothetical protein CC78DRAFT_573300 [Didymosphaeria enalia]
MRHMLAANPKDIPEASEIRRGLAALGQVDTKHEVFLDCCKEPVISKAKHKKDTESLQNSFGKILTLMSYKHAEEVQHLEMQINNLRNENMWLLREKAMLTQAPSMSKTTGREREERVRQYQGRTHNVEPISKNQVEVIEDDISEKYVYGRPLPGVWQWGAGYDH